MHFMMSYYPGGWHLATTDMQKINKHINQLKFLVIQPPGGPISIQIGHTFFTAVPKTVLNVFVFLLLVFCIIFPILNHVT
jgi:hypothetical protein